MKFNDILDETIEVGDMVLVGKYRNKKAIVKEFGTDKNNQPTIKTDKGERSLYGFRVKKLMDTEEEAARYKAFFDSLLKDYEVSSPDELEGSKKSKFWKELKKY